MLLTLPQKHVQAQYTNDTGNLYKDTGSTLTQILHTVNIYIHHLMQQQYYRLENNIENNQQKENPEQSRLTTNMLKYIFQFLF